VAGCEVAERLFDLRKKFNLLLGDGAGEADDALPLFFADWFRAQPFEAGDEGASEAGQAVTVRENRFALDGVKGQANLRRRVLVVIEEADECGDGSFEVDVVFPQCVVRVDEKRLAGGNLEHGTILRNRSGDYFVVGGSS